MTRRLNPIKVKRTSEALKANIALRIVGDGKSSLTSNERLLQGG